MCNYYPEQPAVPFFITDVVGVASQMKKYIYLYELTHTKKRFSLFFPHTTFLKISLSRLSETIPVSRNCLHSYDGFWEKLMKNTG